MNCFYRMIDRGKAFNLISIRYHCQRSSPQQISGITNFQVPSQITAQKMKFFIKDFFSKCDQICRNLRIWSHLLKKSLIGNFSFCAVIASSKMTSYLKMLPVTKICFRHIIQTAITWANQVIWSSVLNSSQLRPLSTL